jgi:hypothetical protein
MYVLSFFRVPKGVLERLDYYRSRFFWQCDEHKKKYRLARWSILHKPVSVGGMGIIDLDIQNKCLLSKWVIKLLNDDGLWQQILMKKYLKGKTLSQVVKKAGDSHFWSGLMEVKDLMLMRGRFKVHDGTQARFWEDSWLGKDPLMSMYPNLYRIVRRKNMLVAQVLSTTPLNVSFRRALVGENWWDWLDLVGKVMTVTHTEHKDCFLWTVNKTFSVKKLYNDVILSTGARANCWAWKAKIPLKIKVFLWFLKNGVVLTKDNLVKRRWKGCIKCCFCAQQETVQHLFFDCPMAKLVWGCVAFAFGINKPINVQHLFGPWLRSFSKEQRNLVLIGMTALCWAIWISRNDLVFNIS